MKTAVVTAVRGRTSHLRNQLTALARSSEQVDRHIVVAIDDDQVAAVVSADDLGTTVIPYCSTTPQLPMAAARNLGAQTAIDGGADLLVFLDVDCIPAPDMVTAYRWAAEHPDHRDALLCGPVTYLPPPPANGYDLAGLAAMANPHPARPAPAQGVITTSTDYELFWSLSFAILPAVWQRIGGFCTDYTGYGGEDTDFAQKAAAQGVTMRWVGGAHAFHQFHPVSNPPVEHLHDIVANAIIFHRRWGWWPMQGWLNAFEAQGLITRDLDGRPVVI
ncbi:MAG: galactosyltransferase-related protein [Mycobacterium sp.]